MFFVGIYDYNCLLKYVIFDRLIILYTIYVPMHEGIIKIFFCFLVGVSCEILYFYLTTW